jgi:hypothetical protein
MKLKKQDIVSFIHASSNFGGMGIEPLNDKAVKIVKAAIEYKVKVNDPPLLMALAKGQDSIKDVLKQQYLKGVDFGKVGKKVTPFQLKISTIQTPTVRVLDQNVLACLNTPPLQLSPTHRPEISPSIVWANKELIKGARRKEIIPLAKAFMSDESISVLTRLMSTSNLHVIKEWCAGDILGSPPVSLKSGNIIMSPLYNTLASQYVGVALAAGSVSFNLIKRAQYQAEKESIKAIAGYPVQITD